MKPVRSTFIIPVITRSLIVNTGTTATIIIIIIIIINIIIIIIIINNNNFTAEIND